MNEATRHGYWLGVWATKLAYLSRDKHREAISNSRLRGMDERGATFRWKDYRAKGRTRYKAMTLSPEEFMRRFLLHVRPSGFHRIRHFDCWTTAVAGSASLRHAGCSS